MTGFDGNDGMRLFGALSDDDVEQVLSGQATADEDLAPLVDFVVSLRAESTRMPDETAVTQRVAAAVAAVGESLAARPAGSDETAPIREQSRRSKVFRTFKTRAAGVLTLVGLLTGASGVAWAANGTAPGEALHSLDKAMETFGILNGGAEERLQEARDLIESGDFAGGLGSAADAVTQAGVADSSAPAALEEAAAKVSGSGDAASQDVREGVALLLEYLGLNLDAIDGATVAGMAQDITGAAPDPGPASVPPVTAPPATVPPVTAPPVTAPPVTAPPVTAPPVTAPPITVPPVTPPTIPAPPAP